ncbi:copper homeostasis protein CutC [Modestobacter sp. VKM Ac-2985]|uniref:copper homeostasis protein CutC n=1 Tax=Modestobacter sp. VKM Ac-2985 TaxID=3004139 RepID=UPI0022AB5D78|nr:copper homeostasis protein CutC [Modestobacter sp. VKM Ac-2985]MCZ2839890.1 copper homeostasis protein CutC [Modestobacter sp. VKM Ac-2985]
MTAVEICIDDVAGATIAQSCGADRVEVCAALSEGGTTPSIGLVSTVLAEASRIGVQVLIRPRAGDFVYSPAEVDVMLADIAAVRALPASAPVGFVVGALTAEGSIDTAVLSRLVAAAGPSPVTFHRAFDTLPDLPAALPVLVSAGVARVLTSGGAPTAAAGAEVLRSLVELAGDRITVLAGGSVRGSNVASLVAETGVPEVHLRAASPVTSSSRSATAVSYDAVPRLVTSAGPIRAVVEALAS